jgi:hypothetical protein
VEDILELNNYFENADKNGKREFALSKVDPAGQGLLSHPLSAGATGANLSEWKLA